MGFIFASVASVLRPAFRGFLGTFSQRSPRHYYHYSEREVGSGTPPQQESVEQSRRNGTANTFHTSLGVTANFLYSVFDWKHISNIFSWSHLERTKQRGRIIRGRERAIKRNSKVLLIVMSYLSTSHFLKSIFHSTTLNK